MSQPAATTPPRLLTPNMQNEVDALVFRPRRLPAAAPSPSPSARAPLAVPNDQVAYVRQPRTHAGADTAAPHMRGYATVMADGNDTSLPFDKVYSERYVHKDTEDHFGEGMVMAATEHEFHGMDLPFDSVYSQAHVDKDTEDHFGSGLMTLEKDEDALARERFLAARQQQYAAAREKLIAEMPKEAAHMGHEQGDAESHFLPGEMNLSEKVSTMLPFDRVYDSRFDGKSASGHFDDGMQLGSKATAGNSFDLVYGAEHEGRVAESHFVPGTMHTEPTSKSLGLPGQSAPKITRYPPLTREQMIPPHRPKFLRGTCGEAGKPPQLSAEMQKHVDSVTFRPAASPPRSPAALLRPATVGGGAPASVGGGPGGASCASSSLQGGRTAPGSGGHASGAGTGRVEQLPSSQKKCAARPSHAPYRRAAPTRCTDAPHRRAAGVAPPAHPAQRCLRRLRHSRAVLLPPLAPLAPLTRCANRGRPVLPALLPAQ